MPLPRDSKSADIISCRRTTSSLKQWLANWQQEICERMKAKEIIQLYLSILHIVHGFSDIYVFVYMIYVLRLEIVECEQGSTDRWFNLWHADHEAVLSKQTAKGLKKSRGDNSLALVVGQHRTA